MNTDEFKELPPDEFRRFRDLVHAHSGIYLEDSSLDALRISLVTRATIRNQVSLAEYYQALEHDDHELSELMNLITINETSFFRFPAQFGALRDSVLPEIMAAKKPDDRSLRFWSAGCSTGEEPYSISMTVLDMGLDTLGWDLSVLGTDVSMQALARAEAGEYGRRTMMNVTPDILVRHFEQLEVGDRYRINERVRSVVGFEYQNLIKEPYPIARKGKWDVIFCRNVTIYFRPESTRRVVANFFDSLTPGGYLFIGHSETLASVSDAYEPVEAGGVFLYRKPHGLFAPYGAARRGREMRLVFEHDADRKGHGDPPQSVRQGRAPESSVTTEKLVSVCRAESVRVEETVSSGPDLLETVRVCVADGDVAAGMRIIDELLAGDANNAEAHLLRAYLHADAGDYDEALRSSHQALAINPLMPFAHYILGIIYQRQGDSVRAVSELKKTLYVDSGFVLAHLNLANIYKSQRKWDLAAREYENALGALHKNPEGEWTQYSGGFKADLLAKTCERSLIECRKAAGAVQAR